MGLVLLLALLRPGIGILAAVIVLVLAPGRWWRWRTRRFRRGLKSLRRGDTTAGRSELERFLGEIEGDSLFRRAQPVFNLGRRYSYRAAALGNLGIAALREDRTEEARRRFREALEEDPDAARAHYGMALLRRKENDREGAERAAERALALRPEYLAASVLLALVRRERGDEPGAERALSPVREAGEDPGKLLEDLRELWG